MPKNSKSRGIRIQTRIIISLFIILIEICLMAFSVSALAEKTLWIYTLAELISIIMVIHIVNIRGNQSYKIMWIIFILLVPIFGVSAYLLWGGGRMFPHLKKRMQACNKKYISFLPEDSKVKNALKYNDLLHFRQAEYLSGESGFPVFNSTSGEFLSPGEKFFEKLLDHLKKAKKFIFIEFFILAEGYMWDKIYEILKQKAESDVEIKIIFDDFGSIKRQTKNFVANLRKCGIQVSVFNPIRPSVDIFMNNRNHRKIVVIDGEVAFTGGINIGDEYINKIERFGHWLDCGIMISGNAVNSFTAMFCSMWEFTTKKEINIQNYLKENISDPDCDGFYLPYCDDPLGESNPAQGIYMQMLNTAQKYVYIATPYLILDSNMINALCLAAKSGIDVKIITPFKPDKWYVHPVTQYYYSELLDNGVQIFEYTPGFIHSKIFVSDNSVATIGTINMDYRSFYFHFECGVWISCKKTAVDIKTDFENTLKLCKKIKPEEWKNRPLITKLKQAILHLFAPLM